MNIDTVDEYLDSKWPIRPIMLWIIFKLWEEKSRILFFLTIAILIYIRSFHLKNHSLMSLHCRWHVNHTKIGSHQILYLRLAFANSRIPFQLKKMISNTNQLQQNTSDSSLSSLEVPPDSTSDLPLSYQCLVRTRRQDTPHRHLPRRRGGTRSASFPVPRYGIYFFNLQFSLFQIFISRSDFKMNTNQPLFFSLAWQISLIVNLIPIHHVNVNLQEKKWKPTKGIWNTFVLSFIPNIQS